MVGLCLGQDRPLSEVCIGGAGFHHSPLDFLEARGLHKAFFAFHQYGTGCFLLPVAVLDISASGI